MVSAGIQHGTPKTKLCEVVGLYNSLDGCCLDARLDGLHDSESPKWLQYFFIEKLNSYDRLQFPIICKACHSISYRLKENEQRAYVSARLP